MDENTTTDQTTPVDTGAETAQPVAEEVVDAAAVTTGTEPSDETATGAEAETQPDQPAVSTELQKYAESQGIPLDSPGAIKAAEIARKAQGEATRNGLKASELEKATNITEDQIPANAPPETRDNVRIRNMELKMDIQSWKIQNPDKLAHEAEMVKVLSDTNKRMLVQEGYLSLDDVYNLARAGAPDNSAAVKSEGKREALQSLAHKQQAAVPAGHATNPAATPKEKPLREMSREERRAKLGYVRQ